MPINITDADFATNVLESDIPVLLDFWAPWCGPCKMIAPILEELAKSYAGKIKICKINIDENTQSAAEYGVRSIPTLLLFQNGQVKATSVGALSKTDLTTFIDNNI